MQILTKNNSILVIVDVQERLISSMSNQKALIENLSHLLRGMTALKMPIILTEQYPEKLGKTVDDLSSMLHNPTLISKLSFSCWQESAFRNKLTSVNHKNVILAGIEAHVCVYQSAIDLINNGFNVHLVADAVSSRKDSNRDFAIERMKQDGVKLTTSEMVLFELVRVAQGEDFKQILKIIR